jgi:solute carrier family 25 citrate transporter 1
VLTGIVPKMAIRFTSYEWYKQALADNEGIVTGKATFLGKLLIITHAFTITSPTAISYQEQ